MPIPIKSISYKNTLLYLIGCILFFSTIQGHSQTVMDTLIASQYFKKGEIFLTDRKLDSAKVYFTKALPIYQNAMAWEQVARCYNKIAENQYRDRKYKESLASAKRALKISTIHLPQDNKEKAFGYDNIGRFYRKMNEYQVALKYHQKALAIRLKIFGDNHPDISSSYIHIGIIYYYEGEYANALKFYKKALVIKTKKFGEYSPEAGNICFNLGITYSRMEKFDEALLYLNKDLLIQNKQPNKDTIKISATRSTIAGIHKKNGRYDKAIALFKKDLPISINHFKKNPNPLIAMHKLIGNCYKIKGDYTNALYHYNKGLYYYDKAYLKSGTPTGFRVTTKYDIYNSIGNLYKDKGEYNKSLKYYKKSLHGNLEDEKKNISSISINYSNIAAIHRLMRNYDEALGYYIKSLALKKRIYGKNHSQLGNLYYEIGKLHVAKKEYDKALYYYNKTLSIQEVIYDKNHPVIADSYTSLGNVCFHNKEYITALEYYKNSLGIQQQTFGNQHPKIASTYNDIAKIYLTQKDYKNSLYYYEKGINANLIRKTHINYPNQINSDQYFNTNILLTSLKGKARVCTGLYNQNKDFDTLKNAIQTYQQADALINDMRQTFTNYQDKVIFAQKAKEIYQGAITIQLQLYFYQKDQQSLEKAFYYAEKSKSSTLRELLNNTNAKRFIDIPTKLLSLEQELRTDHAFYQSKIIKEKYNHYDKIETLIDTSKIVEFENKLFETVRLQDSLVIVLEKEYPKYYVLKHKNKIVSVTDIQKNLKKHTTILEFFTSDSSTYVFTISKDKIAVQELSTPNLPHNVEKLRTAITSKDLAAYKKTGYNLYKQLIAPIAEQLVGDQLIIIPDGPLWHCNFELLLTQQDASNNPVALSYVLRDYAISYANSANLMFRSNQSDIPIQKRQECLAFSFSDSTQIAESKTMSLARLRDSGNDLPGTRKEIKAISNIIDGQYYYGSQAIEANFKKNAGQYNILHLALHGDVDNEHPENSKLYFTKSKDTIEDNLLYSHELFALDIPAELTVLSACNTGAGKIATGEGIMSLGTAFKYAGTKSLLLTSWEVSDQTTPELMQYFYTNLKAGMHKAKALQQAKLQYLSTANINRTQPFYWAGFYLVGDTAPIPFENNELLYWVLGGLIVLIVLGGLFWYRRKRK